MRGRVWCACVCVRARACVWQRAVLEQAPGQLRDFERDVVAAAGEGGDEEGHGAPP